MSTAVLGEDGPGRAGGEDHDVDRRARRGRARSGRRRAVVGLGLVLGAVSIAGLLASGQGAPTGDMASDAAAANGVRGADRFAELASQHTNYCSLDPDTVMGYPDSRHMQGSCCNPMDRDRYRQQVDGLRRYADIPEVPRDPYDIEADLAKQLLRYDETITFDAADQATYDAAMGMTDDGGPCCCQCWRWYMTRGLAKFLITRYDMPAAEVAEITDLLNGCGGPAEPADSS